jgi:hypothetical protein
LLEGLEEIDWNSLRHCYGPAGDVPEWLRALRSDDPERREWGFKGLFGNLLHQGSAYEASARAVPFLTELALDPDTASRDRILSMIDGIAIGYDEFVLPQGVNPAYDDYEPYAAVRECVPALRPLLWAGEDLVEAEAARLLAWFPAHAEESIQALWARYADAPPDMAAGCLVAIGLVAGRGDREQIARLAPLLHHPDNRHWWGAAIALARLAGDDPPAGTLEALLRAALGGVPEYLERETMVFNDGFMRSYAARSFQLVGPAVRPTAVALVIDGLARSDRRDGVSLAEGLLATVFEQPGPQDVPFTALEPLQQEALRGLFGAPWFRPGYRSEFILTRYSLPGDPDTLADYVNGRRRR